MEKSKKSINVEGGKNIKINKRVSTFIREMRELKTWIDSNDSHNFVVCFSKNLNSLLFFQLDEEYEDDEENLDDPETPEGISKTKPKTKESKPKTKETNDFEDSFINDGEDQSESDFDFEVCFFYFT